MKYNNYHKHDHVSNIFIPDVVVKTKDYLARAKELEHDTYFTTNHGSGGDVFESLTLCKQENIHCKFGVEGYIVPDPLEKDKRNYHIILIPTDNVARKKLNKITSHASFEGYYYRPRIFIDDLLKLNKNDLFITTACIAGLLRDEDSINKIFIPLVQHFGKNVMLEVQNHNDPEQIRVNKLALEYADIYGLDLIAANDSHYIYPYQAEERQQFLVGKGINYGTEDTFLLDYPSGDEMLERFVKQGVLQRERAIQAIEKTRIFDVCEDINIDKEIKMPSAYPSMTEDEKIAELKRHINKKFKQIKVDDKISKEELPHYIQGIKDEMKVIENTKVLHTADYFLLNEKIVDLATNRYGGVLTRTGRGSCGGFYINRILGMTQLDRFRSKIKLYPERFMSEARLLENHSSPDIDYNVVSQEPFIKATKEILGENGCYPMIAYGTMQLGEAFRNVCRSHGLNYDEYNEVAKNIENYEKSSKWSALIDEAKIYIDTIISASVHPCAFLLDNKDLTEEYGVVKVGDAFCVMITSGEADEYHCLKDDFLIVVVWKLISETFELIGKPIISVKELLDNVDDKVWKLYENGLTCTLNQTDGDWATKLIKTFKPRNAWDLAMFAACLRPFFEPWRDGFVRRENYTTGSRYLDEVLKGTKSYILYQECLMQYFEWLGVAPAESIGLIKKISKKKIKESDFKNLEERIKKNWIEKTGSIDDFYEVWKMVQSCMAYGFCSAHALAVGIDNLYGAYLKANYPYEYYTIALNNYIGDEDRTNRLTDELKYFGITIKDIKFGKCSGEYTLNREEKAIYKGVGSIKFINPALGDELYTLRDNHYDSFIDLLKDIREKTTVNSKQLDILIKLDFFSEFGDIRKLLKTVEIYNLLTGKKQMSKAKITELELPLELFLAHGKETKSLVKELDIDVIMNELISEAVKDPTLRADDIDKIKWQIELLGYSNLTIPKANKRMYVVQSVASKKTLTIIQIYEVFSGKTREVKAWNRQLHEDLKQGDIIDIYKIKKDNQKEPTGEVTPDGKKIYRNIPDKYEYWLTSFEVLA